MNAPREFIRINVHLKIFSLVCVSFHSSQMPAIGSSVPPAALMNAICNNWTPAQCSGCISRPQQCASGGIVGD